MKTLSIFHCRYMNQTLQPHKNVKIYSIFLNLIDMSIKFNKFVERKYKVQLLEYLVNLFNTQ